MATSERRTKQEPLNDLTRTQISLNMMKSSAAKSRPRRGSAFTLIELLVVIAILALLIAILLPSLHRARESAKSVVCKSRLSSIMTAVHAYAAPHDAIVPSYNMQGISVNPNNVHDGWGPILVRDGFITASRELHGNPLACPNTLAIPGMASGGTGFDLDKPKGYMDWPSVKTLSAYYPGTIPERDFDRLIRVAYWINGDNPIGIPQPAIQDINFTGSVGYGPDYSGRYVRTSYFANIRRPGQLIAFADGLYSGMQESTRIGSYNSRIGYRHPGREGVANIAFADGHVGDIESSEFPRKPGAGVTLEEVREENLGSGPTIYSDPERFLLPWVP